MSQQQKEARRKVELPDECWELIFNRLRDDYRFEVISLVSRQFLSVSCLLKRSLTITDPTICYHLNLSHFFQRFHKISIISLKCVMSVREFNDIVLEISRSGLDLFELNVSQWTRIDVDVLTELALNMTNLTTLRFGYNVLTFMDLVAITCPIPQLRALYIKPANWNNVSDLTDEEGIELVASKVRELRTIDMSGNLFITDNWLIALSSKCEYLTELVVGNFPGRSCQLTENGIGFALRHCQNLTSLSLSGIKANDTSVSSAPSTLFSFENSISHARVLCELEIHHMDLSDAMLCSIAKARLPLKKLALCSCKNFSYSGLSSLLQEYQSIIHLKLGEVDFLTDQLMNDLSMFLRNVSHLQIWECFQLTDLTFFILTEKCPFLVELKLGIGGLGPGGNFPLELTENHNIKSLQLSCNTPMNDNALKRFGLICPAIQFLDINGCVHVTQKGIGEILKSCSKLTHLEVYKCKGRRILGTGSAVSRLNLKVLQARGTMIDDKGMALIGTRCRWLQKLELDACMKITEKGVKEVLEKCVDLREITLWGCRLKSSDVVPWMMSARPSLRKIVPPGGIVSKEEQRNLFLRYGCVVCNH